MRKEDDATGGGEFIGKHSSLMSKETRDPCQWRLRRRCD